MSNATCAKCGETFAVSGGPGRPRTKCLFCAPPKRQRQSQRKPVDVKECVQCGRAFRTSYSVKVYCSDGCREKAKHRRQRSEYEVNPSGRYGKNLAKARDRYRRDRDARGIPPRVVFPHCQHPEGCEAKVYARHMCLRHYRRTYSQPKQRRTYTAMCWASRFGYEESKKKPIKFRLATGVVAFCPWCGHGMFALSLAARECPLCLTIAVL